MSKCYPSLQSPLIVRGKIIPSRMGFSRAVPIFITGTNDKRPLDTMVDFAGDTARNGAAIVTCASGKFPNDIQRSAEFAQIHHSAADPKGEEDETGFRAPEPGEMDGFDMTLDEVCIKYARMVEAIHDEGSLACISMMDIEPFGWTCDEMSTEELDKMINMFVRAAKVYAGLGFDVMCFYMSAGKSILGMSLSPYYNHRTDKFGGSNMTERANGLAFEIFRRIRKACPNVLIEAQIYDSDDVPEGYNFEDLKEFVRAAEAEDLVDIIQLRTYEGGSTYLDSTRKEPSSLKYAAELKKMGTKIVIAPVAGFWDPRKNDEYIREGKCDFIYMAHSFLSDAEYGKKVKEGRPEDIVPCLRCNKCHSRPGDPDGGCAVNPQLFLSVSDREYWQAKPAVIGKKVAVIGGGPGGMEAAIIATRRGHDVTLYEMKDVLGGQLRHSDYFTFKWSVKEFMDYMIAQVSKCGCRIVMNTKATPELLASEGYDTIVVATGAAPKVLKVPGAENAIVTEQVLGNESKLGKSAVIIGGAETGCEYGLHLALSGIETTVLTRRNRLANDAQAIHYREYLMDTCRKAEKFHYITHAATTAILPNGVKYTDQDGVEHVIEADTVIMSAGVAPRQEDIPGFADIADEIFYVGDCRAPKDIRRAMKQAFSAAIRI